MSDDDALALRDDARKQMLRVQLELLSRAMDLPDTPEHVRDRHSTWQQSERFQCASMHSVKSTPDLESVQPAGDTRAPYEHRGHSR